MNLLTFREHHVYQSDACERGLGGYSASGRAWRWEIPTHLQGRAHINLLEFIAAIVGIWIDIIEGAVVPESCILSMGDNTSATGWLKKSNFKETDERQPDQTAKLKCARQLARLQMNAKSMLYSQWFPGAHNHISDSLSRDWHLTMATLIQLLTLRFPEQMPQNFEISPIPTVIESFILETLQHLPVQKPRCKTHKTSGIEIGDDGTSFLPQLESLIARSSKPSTSGNGQFSFPFSRKECERPPSLHELSIPWLREQSTPLSTMWHRPSGLVTGKTRDWIGMATKASSSSNNSEATAMKMPAPNNKRHSQ